MKFITAQKENAYKILDNLSDNGIIDEETYNKISKCIEYDPETSLEYLNEIKATLQSNTFPYRTADSIWEKVKRTTKNLFNKFKNLFQKEEPKEEKPNFKYKVKTTQPESKKQKKEPVIKQYKSKTKKTNPKLKTKTKHTTPKKPYIRRQDQSMPVLEDLLEQGYDMVTFEARAVACPLCQRMNGTTWTLQEFLDTTEYMAPIFFHLHVNCLDEVRVWSSNFSLPTVYVDWQGRIR